MDRLNFMGEVKRKLIHFASSIIGLSVIYLDKEIILPLLIISTFLYTIFDYFRLNNNNISIFYNIYFGSITRSFEANQFTGATYVFWGALFTYIVFDNNLAGIALIVLSFADGMAAIIGVGYGKTKLLNKTLEGSFAFFLTTLLILYLFHIPLEIALAVSFIATLTEAIKIPRINDNISIPIVVSLLLTISGI